MSVTLRRAKPEDAAECGRICYEAFKNISERHGFPPDIPGPEMAAGFLSQLISMPLVYAMVAEDGGRAMVWPEDVPPEVTRAAEAEARRMALLDGHRRAEAKAPPSSRPPSSSAPPRSKRELPPYLRVIK